jgi:hypothetical protein
LLAALAPFLLFQYYYVLSALTKGMKEQYKMYIAACALKKLAHSFGFSLYGTGYGTIPSKYIVLW